MTSNFNKEELNGYSVIDFFGECEELLGISGGVEEGGDLGGSPPPLTPLTLTYFPYEPLPSPFFWSYKAHQPFSLNHGRVLETILE